MSRKRREPIDVLTKVIGERQPIRISLVMDFAMCYVNCQEMGRKAVYAMINESFTVKNDFVSVKKTVS